MRRKVQDLEVFLEDREDAYGDCKCMHSWAASSQQKTVHVVHGDTSLSYSIAKVTLCPNLMFY